MEITSMLSCILLQKAVLKGLLPQNSSLFLFLDRQTVEKKYLQIFA